MSTAFLAASTRPTTIFAIRPCLQTGFAVAFSVRRCCKRRASDKKTFANAMKRKDAFEFCRASCRTSSKSTVHGNAYISEKRFCLSPSILSQKLPADVTVSLLAPASRVTSWQITIGKQGESCADVCRNVGKGCDARYVKLRVSLCFTRVAPGISPPSTPARSSKRTFRE
eukprot:766752-Hanusia_phi.AAC.4